MSKWTLQKILDCEEIKLGATFSHSEFRKQIILRKDHLGIRFWDEKIGNPNGYSSCGNIWKNFTFYRPDGTEILPPKEKVMKKFYTYCMGSGASTGYFYSEDLKTYWGGDREEEVVVDCNSWTMTNCFIEKEVEA